MNDAEIRANRFRRIQQLISDAGINALYLVDYTVNYLKGWQGYAIFVPAGEAPIVLCGDNDRELPMIEWKAWAAAGMKWVTDVDLFTLETLKKLCVQCGADKGRIGIPVQFLTVPRFEAIKKELPDAEIVDISKELIALTDDNDELNLHYAKESARIVEEAFEVFCSRCKIGMTGAQMKSILDCYMLENGVTGTFNLVKPVYRKPEYQSEDPDILLPGDGWYCEVTAAWENVWTQAIYTVSIGEENALLQRLVDSNVAAYRKATSLIKAGVSSNVLNAPIDAEINRRGLIGPGQHVCLPIGHYEGMRMDGGCYSPGADLPLTENLIMVIHTASKDPETGVSLFGPGGAMIVTKTGVRELYEIQEKVRVVG